MIYSRDFRGDVDLDTSSLVECLGRVIQKSANLYELVNNYQKELITTYNAPNQCTVTLLSIIRAIYLTQVRKPVKEEGLHTVDPMTYHQYRRFKPFKDSLKIIGRKLMKKVSLQDLWEAEIDGTEHGVIVV